MIFALLTVSILHAAAEPVKVAAPALQLVNLDPKLGDFYTEHLAQQLTFQGVRTQTPKDIAAVLGHERERKLLGCADHQCTSELGQVLGVDGLLLGTVTKLAKTYQLNVRIVSTSNAQLLATASTTSDDSDRFVASFSLIAQELARQLSAKLGREIAADSSVSVTTTATTVKRMSWLPLAGGAAGAIVGGIFFSQAAGTHSRLVTRTGTALTAEESATLVQNGQRQQLIGWVGTGIGIAGIAAAATMFFLGGNEEIRASVAVGPGAASFGISGALP